MANMKIIIGGVAAIFLVAIAIFVWMTLPSASPSVEEPVVAAPQQMATSTYATTTYSLVYPNDFSVNREYVNDQVNPKKPIYGVKFIVPIAMATGTNLSSYDTGISVEQLPRAKNCTGDIYLAADVKPITVTENGVRYSVAISSGAATGNRYEEVVYALSDSSPCTAMRYFIHSTAIENYSAGAIREFDREELIAAFDTIRQSLRLGPVSAPASQIPAQTP